MDEVQNKESRFNAGIDKLKRIGELKRRIHMGRAMNDLDLVRQSLISVSRELYERMSDESQEVTKEAAKLERNMNFFVDLYYHPRGIVVNFNIVSESITAFENFLNRKEFEYGMSMPDKEDARYAMGH